MDTVQFLRLPFEALTDEKIFIIQCDAMNFTCLEDILILSPSELFGHPGFSYLWLEQLSRLLQAQGLLHLLQATPGKSAY